MTKQAAAKQAARGHLKPLKLKYCNAQAVPTSIPVVYARRRRAAALHSEAGWVGGQEEEQRVDGVNNTNNHIYIFINTYGNT